MISRFIHITALTLLSLVCATPAEANWLADFAHCIARDTKRRNCWPKPFVAPDREAVRAPFALMVSHGWRRQNMLGDHHFVDEKSELTEAGRLKVRWILVEAPLQHRSIYVHVAETPEITAARISSIQQFIVQVAPGGPFPPVLETTISDEGWPASQVDAVGRKFEASTPNPRLPEAAPEGGGGE